MSNCYCHPGRAGGSPHPLVFRNFAIGTGERMLPTVVQEFVLRRLTPAAKRQYYEDVH
jgi:hypothetical protein